MAVANGEVTTPSLNKTALGGCPSLNDNNCPLQGILNHICNSDSRYLSSFWEFSLSSVTVPFLTGHLSRPWSLPNNRTTVRMKKHWCCLELCTCIFWTLTVWVIFNSLSFQKHHELNKILLHSIHYFIHLQLLQLCLESCFFNVCKNILKWFPNKCYVLRD